MTDAAPELSMAERIDALCDQFEQNFRAGRQTRIEECLGNAQEPFRSTLLQAMIGLEVELRQKRGETPRMEEYKARFPKQEEAVRQAFTDVRSILSSVKVSTAETSKGPAVPASPPKNDGQPLTQLGRFQIISVLGEGAFGTVYKAHDPQLDRDVALKVPRFGSQQSKEDRERFLREARSAAGLHHALICPVHEVGTIEGRDYIVMAFIDGKPLSKVLQTQTRLSDKQIVSVVRKIALALQEAHDKGIIHRDLKPANIMINRKGEPVIMDFGLARRSNAGDAQISHSGQIMGTPAYMSPEQARGDGKSVGPAADIYSLGVMFYELLCGRRPYEGTITEVIGQILHVDAEPPSLYRPGVDPRLEEICLKALAKQPTDRFASMKEFAEALANFAKTNSTVQANAAATETKPAKDEPLQTKQFARLIEAVSSDFEEKVERAARRAVRKSRKSQKVKVPWWTYLVGSGLIGVIIFLGIFFFIRKDTVTVIVNIPIENINDPALSFLLDNQPIAAEKFASPIELKPGEHELVVNKGGKEFKRFLFNVGKADNQPVVVQDVTPKPTGPRRVDVRELNLTGYDTLPWLSRDGLTIYFESRKRDETTEIGPWIWSARRTSAQAAFGEKVPLFPGRHPTLTGDELEMIFIRGQKDGGTLRYARRNFISEPLAPAGPITELADQDNVKSPYLAEDGLTLVFQRGRDDAKSIEFVVCTRPNRQSPWSRPQRLPITPDPTWTEPLTWPFLSRDGLTLWYCHGGGMAPDIRKATRPDGNSAFGNHQPVIVEGTPLIGRSPRFVEATGELFYSPNTTEIQGNWSLWKVDDYAEPVADDGWIDLFNGKDLTGWKTNGIAEGWAVKNGEIVTEPLADKPNMGWLMTEKSYDNFELQLEFMTSERTDSGVAFRCDPEETSGAGHAEIQIIDEQDAELVRKMDEGPHRRTGALAGHSSLRTLPMLERGVWHTMSLEVNGRSLKVAVDGIPTVDTNLNDHIEEAKKMNRKGIWQPIGSIGLAKLKGVARFRNIRIRPLNSAPVTNGWIDLFNGKDLSNWVTVEGKAPQWKVENGYMEVVPGTKSIITGDNYPLDFELHAEFWVPKEPGKRDQGRGNSGIYLHGRHEVQICDGFQNPIAKPKTACGALFGDIAPVLNACTPPETWQTFDITYHSPRVDGSKVVTKPGRLTVIHNGQKIIDDETFKSVTGATWHNDKIGQPGPIMLQDHGSKVRFRNIRIRPLASDDLGWKPLFPGDDFSAWKGRRDVWSLQNGVLTGKPSNNPNNTFLFSPKDYRDFELRFQVRAVGDKVNSGIQIRSVVLSPESWKARGPQCDIGNRSGDYWGGLYGEEMPGGWLLKPDRNPTVRPNDFNDYFIRCVGKHVTIRVNGETTVDGPVPAMADTGLIAFQVHRGNDAEVTFRNLEIRETRDDQTVATTIPADAQVFNGHSYKFFPEQLSWKAAQAKCEALGGHLIIIDHLEENAFAAKLITQAGRVDSWIGITDEAKEGAWKTVHGDPLPLVNWWKMQPNNKLPGEHWALMSNKQVAEGFIGWQWSDQPNDSNQHRPGYLCEWDGLQNAAANIALPPEQQRVVSRIEQLGGVIARDVTRPGQPVVLVNFYPAKNKPDDALLAEFRHLPDLQSVNLWGSEPVTNNGLRSLQALTSLQALDLGLMRIDDRGVAHLTALSELVNLNLSYTLVTDASLRSVASLRNLKSLALDNLPITDDGLANLATLTELRNLNLLTTHVRGPGLKHIGVLTKLEQLWLSNSPVTDDALKHLTSLTALQQLYLAKTKVTDAGLNHLAGMASLRELTLHETKVTAQGIEKLHREIPKCRIEWSGGAIEPTALTNLDRAFAEWVIRQRGQLRLETAAGGILQKVRDVSSLPSEPFQVQGFFIDHPMPLDKAGFDLLEQLTGLTTLGIEHDDLTDSDILRISRMPFAKQVTAVDFHGKHLTDAGLESLAGWSSLEDLNFGQTLATWTTIDKLRGLKLKKLLADMCSFGDAALAHLPLFPELEHIDLAGTKVTDEGLIHLTKLPNLQGLVLFKTAVTDAGLKTLQTCSPTLSRLWLRETQVSAEGVAAFRSARPDVSVDADVESP